MDGFLAPFGFHVADSAEELRGSGIGPAGVMVMLGIADDARVRDLTAEQARADHRRDRRDERAIAQTRGRAISAVQMAFLVGSGLERDQTVEAGVEGEPAGDVVAHRLDHRVLAVDAHDDNSEVASVCTLTRSPTFKPARVPEFSVIGHD